MHSHGPRTHRSTHGGSDSGDRPAPPPPSSPPAPVLEHDGSPASPALRHRKDDDSQTSNNSVSASHHTLEKRTGADGRATEQGPPGNGDKADDHAVDDTGTDSDTTYYEYDSGYDEEDGAPADSNSCGSSGDVGEDRVSTPASLSLQEDLLRFLSFTLDEEALKDHRLMAIEAFGQILVLGTNQGTVAVVDPSTGRLKEVYVNHHEPICDVDCTINELYIAACDKAGYVTVQSRRDVQDVWMAELSGPIESVALHPLYHKMDSSPMVCGGASRVLLLTKGFLWSNSRRVRTLQEGRGRIHKIRWCRGPASDVVAWLSDAELTLYDTKSESLVRRVQLPGITAQNCLYPPTLRWEYHSSKDPAFGTGPTAALLCGWGDVVQEVQLYAGSRVGAGGEASVATPDGLQPSTISQDERQDRPSWASPSRAAPVKAPVIPLSQPVTTSSAAGRVPYVARLRTTDPLRPSGTVLPYRVCGIAPYGPQRYVVLAGIVERGAEGVMKDLEVRVVKRDTLTDVYRCRMPVRFIHPLQLRLTYLGVPPTLAGRVRSPASPQQVALPPDPLAPSPCTQYFILSVDTVVKAVPPDIDDHIDFLLRSGQFEQAYRYASTRACQLRRHALGHIGQQWLMHLFHNRDAEDGALLKLIELLPEVVPRDNSAAWEQWIYRLDTCGESWRLIALLPASTGASAEYRLTSPSGVEGYSDTHADPVVSEAPLSAPAVATVQIPIQREYYDLVLLRCLRHDPILFYAALHRFKTLFSVPVVLKATEVAYREQCAAAAWWECQDSDDEGSGVRDGTHEGSRDETVCDASSSLCAVTADHIRVPYVAPAPASPDAPQGGKAEASPAGEASYSPSPTAVADTAAAVTSPPMSRTSRWSLVASYGFLLRCAGRHEEALQVLLHLPSSPRSDHEVFGLIRDERLLHKTLELLPELLHSREEATLQLLLEHVTESTNHNSLADGDGVAVPSPSVADPIGAAARSSPSPSWDTSPCGSAQDPLCAESVVCRLEHNDRLHLLRYLNLVRESHPKVFLRLAKQNAQLVATLYIDYDRPSLLPFLKEMSMYIERIRELHALCHKHNFVEEEIFLLFRMGREDEALRILVEKMHDLPHALKFVVSVPDQEEQAALFTRLVDFTVAYNASLPTCVLDHTKGTPEGCGVRVRYITHTTQPNETYALIAQQYRVTLGDLYRANGVSRGFSGAASAVPLASVVDSKGRHGSDISYPQDAEKAQWRASSDADATENVPDPPPQCVVPLNLLGDLLQTLAEPQFMELPALDVGFVLSKLPCREPILRAGPSIAAIARTMAEEIAFLSTVSKVGERDLVSYYGQLLKRRTAAITIGRGRSPAENGTFASGGAVTVPFNLGEGPAEVSGTVRRCAVCRQLVIHEVVVFACQHMYHPTCVLQCMRSTTEAFAGRGGAVSGGRVGDPAAVIRDGASLAFPLAFTAVAGTETTGEQLRKYPVYCHACRQHAGEPS
ncbi:hypothetical protein JKF63_02927 [Porcisia hertigi]|uniref:Vps41 beta-propeller domain-containing protein n=1 Tax=Porcisia hertigi TaxID=2761500 RepID=A0A836IIU9_9TRYP|nr:hypothetical protein JKF63_02927 [Porcisia hertigi]